MMDRPPETHSEYSKQTTKAGAKGIPMTGEMPREALINVTEAYIYENCGHHTETGQMGKVYFNRLLEDWKNFESDNWTPYDAAVASGLALLAARRFKPNKVERKPMQLVKRYTQKGNRSKRIS